MAIEEGHGVGEGERGEEGIPKCARYMQWVYRALSVRVRVCQVWSPKHTFAVRPAEMASANAVVFHSSGLRLAATWQADMASKRRPRGMSVRSFTTLVSCFATFFFFVGIAVRSTPMKGDKARAIFSGFFNPFLAGKSSAVAAAEWTCSPDSVC